MNQGADIRVIYVAFAGFNCMMAFAVSLLWPQGHVMSRDLVGLFLPSLLGVLLAFTLLRTARSLQRKPVRVAVRTSAALLGVVSGGAMLLFLTFAWGLWSPSHVLPMPRLALYGLPSLMIGG